MRLGQRNYTIKYSKQFRFIPSSNISYRNPQVRSTLNEDFKYSLTNLGNEGITCVGENSSYDRWIKTLGFPHWSKNNCEYAFMSTFLTSCSVVRTNGVEERHEFDIETRKINDASKN